MAESPSDRSNRRHRSRGRRPPTIDLKATPVTEPDPATQAATMADPSDSLGAPADAGPQGEAAPQTGSSLGGSPDAAAAPSDAIGVSADAAMPDEPAAQTASGWEGSPEVVAEPGRAGMAGAPVREPLLVTPAAHLDERLIETAESNGGARTLDHADPGRTEPPASIADPEPIARPGSGDDPGDRERPRGYGLGALLAATMMSGLVGAGLMVLAAPYVRGPVDRVRARIDQVERQVGALAPADLSAIERRLAAIEPEQRSLAERVTRLQAETQAARTQAEQAASRPPPAPSAAPVMGDPAASQPASGEAAGSAVEPLIARLTALEGEVRSLAQPGSDGLDGKLAEQNQRVAALEQRIAQGLEPLAGIGQQLTRQDQALAQQVQRLAQLDQTVTGQTQRMAQLDQTLTGQSQTLAQVDQSLTGQSQKLAQVDQSLTGQSQKLTQVDQTLAGQTQQIATQGQRVAGVEKTLAERSPEAMNAALRVVATDRVTDALRDGSPFPQALAALRRLNPDAAALTPLAPFASAGAPTAAALTEEFRPLGQRIVAEARGPANDVTNRLWRMAEGVVAVRPLNEAGSTSTPGLVARIEDALERGALADAAAAWDALSEPSRQASEVFGRKLKARVAADAAARTISAEALASLDAAAR